jgi:hypothetical protein
VVESVAHFLCSWSSEHGDESALVRDGDDDLGLMLTVGCEPPTRHGLTHPDPANSLRPIVYDDDDAWLPSTQAPIWIWCGIIAIWSSLVSPLPRRCRERIEHGRRDHVAQLAFRKQMRGLVN